MNKDNKDFEYQASFEEKTIQIRGDSSVTHIDAPDNEIIVDNWSRIYESKALVKTKEGILCGNVVSEYNDNIVLIDFAGTHMREYLVPKSAIERYDGNYLYLTIPRDVLASYGY